MESGSSRTYIRTIQRGRENFNAKAQRSQRHAEFTPCNKKDKNNMKVNSPRVIINARIMANKKWKNITWDKRTTTRGLSENFFKKVFVLNVSAVSAWIHVCYTFNNSLRSLRLCVYKILLSFFGSGLSSLGILNSKVT